MTLTTRAMQKTISSIMSTLPPFITRFAKKSKTRVTMTIRRMRLLNRLIPLENSLSFVVSTVSFAIRPMAVRGPVSRTRAVASPFTTDVPLKRRL